MLRACAPFPLKFAILGPNQGGLVREALQIMNITELGQRPKWLVLGAAVMVVVGGTARIITLQTQPLTSSTTPLAPSLGELSYHLHLAAGPEEFLVGSAHQDSNLATISVGRLDPFAPVAQAVGPPRTSQSASAQIAGETTASPESDALPPSPIATSSGTITDSSTLPVVNVSPLPLPLPPIPAATTGAPVTTIPNPGTPVNPVNGIELSGVVQVGSRIGIIARDSNSQTSIHLFAGDYLAGGQVLVKAIDVSAQEPLVILEYQGQEYSRTVGS